MISLMMMMMMKTFRFSSLSLDRSPRRSAKDLFSLGDTHHPQKIGGEKKRFQLYYDEHESCCYCSSKRARGRPFGGSFGGVPSRYIIYRVWSFLWGKREGKNERVKRIWEAKKGHVK
jgi:hypothetical protein